MLRERTHRGAVITIFFLTVGVVIILLLMTVWNPKVQAVFEEYREVERKEEFVPRKCDTEICLRDLANPATYRREVR